MIAMVHCALTHASETIRLTVGLQSGYSRVAIGLQYSHSLCIALASKSLRYHATSHPRVLRILRQTPESEPWRWRTGSPCSTATVKRTG